MPGRPLDVETRTQMERRFGHDFSRVRVHADAHAAASAESLDARAYTLGSHIVFGRDAYQPRRLSGHRLLAHELTHALQQGMVTEAPPDLRLAPSDEAAEREARNHGEFGAVPAAGARGPATPALHRRSAAIARQATQQSKPAANPKPTTTAVDDKAVFHSEQAMNLILEQQFPVANRNWNAGSRGDLATGGDVQADVNTGRDGSVIWAVSPDFAPPGAKATDVAKDPAKIAIVRREVMRVLEWRLGLGILTGDDVAAPFVSDHLRQIEPVLLRNLKGRPKVDAAARAEIDRILAITTQLPSEAKFGSGGAAELVINGIPVRILADTTGGTQNETTFRLIPSQVATPAFRSVKGVVTQIVGPIPTRPTIEIQTSYAATGPQAGADPLTAPSGYGRGTTAADKTAGNTSLRFHESRHGEDFLKFVRTRPFPTYTGAVGMTDVAFRAAGTAYMNAVRAWAQDMGEVSKCATDCVGNPNIDQFEGNTGNQMKCRTCATP